MPSYNRVGINQDPSAPAASAVAVTPSDSTVLDMTRSLYIGGSGNLRVVMYHDSTTTDFIGVLVGSILPLRVKQVYSAGTTATNIVALY